jgi:hypothetical protein
MIICNPSSVIGLKKGQSEIRSSLDNPAHLKNNRTYNTFFETVSKKEEV